MGLLKKKPIPDAPTHIPGVLYVRFAGGKWPLSRTDSATYPGYSIEDPTKRAECVYAYESKDDAGRHAVLGDLIVTLVPTAEGHVKLTLCDCTCKREGR